MEDLTKQELQELEQEAPAKVAEPTPQEEKAAEQAVEKANLEAAQSEAPEVHQDTKNQEIVPQPDAVTQTIELAMNSRISLETLRRRQNLLYREIKKYLQLRNDIRVLVELDQAFAGEGI